MHLEDSLSIDATSDGAPRACRSETSPSESTALLVIDVAEHAIVSHAPDDEPGYLPRNSADMMPGLLSSSGRDERHRYAEPPVPRARRMDLIRAFAATRIGRVLGICLGAQRIALPNGGERLSHGRS